MNHKNHFGHNIVELLKQKQKDVKQLLAESKHLNTKIDKLKSVSLYGKIVLVDKKYHQFVEKSKNGKQRKVYIGKDLEKLADYQKKIENGCELSKLQARDAAINIDLEFFEMRLENAQIR